MLINSSLNFFILGAAAILLIGFLGKAIARKTTIPNIVWLMLFGILIVPVLSLVSQPSVISVLPEVASIVVLILLFNAGLTLNIKRLLSLVSRVALSAFVNFAVAVLAVFTMMYILNFGLIASIITGLVVGSVSAEIIPAISKVSGPKEKNKNLVSLESAITEPLCIIIVLIAISAILLNNYQIGAITYTIVSGLSIGIVLAAILAMSWIPAMSYLQRNNYVYSYAASLALVLILYVLVQTLGGSAPMSALIFGLVIANGEDIYKMLGYRHSSSFNISRESKAFNDLITFFTISFFFVYFGALINLNDYYGLLLGVTIGLGLLIARAAGSRIALYKSQFSQRDKTVVSYMVSRGTGAAVCAILLFAYGIVNQWFLDVIFAVIITTIAANAIFLSSTKGELEDSPVVSKKRLKEQELEKDISKYV